MLNFLLEEINNSLDTGNYYVALVSALTAIDIATSYENSGNTTKDLFVKWFEDNLQNKYTVKFTNDLKVFLNGADCYALRCKVLHCGSDFTGDQRASDVLEKFKFTTANAHNNFTEFNGKSRLQLNVKWFCTDVVNSISSKRYPIPSNALIIYNDINF